MDQQQLRNRTIRIAVLDDPPFTSSCTFEPTCPHRGSAVETASLVCQYLDLDCRFVPYDSRDSYGTGFKNGSGTGVIGAVARGEFDTALPNMMPTYVRSYAVDFTHAYYYVQTILVTRRGGDQTTNRGAADLGWSVVVRAFQWRVWCSFALVLLLTGVAIACVSCRLATRDASDRRRYKHGSWRVVWRILEMWLRLASSIVEHGHNKRRPISILSVTWGLCIVVLSSAYTGFLFSNKVITSDDSAPFVDFEGFVRCVEEGRCSVVTPTLDLSYMHFLTEPDSPHGPRLTRAFGRHNPVRIVEKASIPSAILRERAIHLVWITGRNDLPGHIDEKNRCAYLIVPTPETTAGGFITKKGGGSRRLAELFDLMSSVFREHGLEYATGLEMLDEGCAAGDSVVVANQKLNFDNGLRVPFFFFLAGMGGAFLVLLIERRYGVALDRTIRQ